MDVGNGLELTEGDAMLSALDEREVCWAMRDVPRSGIVSDVGG